MALHVSHHDSPLCRFSWYP